MTTKSDTVKTGKAKAQSTATAAKERAKSVRSEAESAARGAAQSVRKRVEDESKAARDAVANQVDSVAETIEEAAENMTDGSPQAEAAERIGDTIAGAAQSLRDSDLATLGDSLAQTARRHPVAFAGVAALAGFAAGRFLKATAPKPQMSSARPNPRDGYSQATYGAPVQSPPPSARPARPVQTSTQSASHDQDVSNLADSHTPGRGSA